MVIFNDLLKKITIVITFISLFTGLGGIYYTFFTFDARLTKLQLGVDVLKEQASLAGVKDTLRKYDKMTSFDAEQKRDYDALINEMNRIKKRLKELRN